MPAIGTVRVYCRTGKTITAIPTRNSNYEDFLDGFFEAVERYRPQVDEVFAVAFPRKIKIRSWRRRDARDNRTEVAKNRSEAAMVDAARKAAKRLELEQHLLRAQEPTLY